MSKKLQLIILILVIVTMAAVTTPAWAQESTPTPPWWLQPPGQIYRAQMGEVFWYTASLYYPIHQRHTAVQEMAGSYGGQQ